MHGALDRVDIFYKMDTDKMDAPVKLDIPNKERTSQTPTEFNHSARDSDLGYVVLTFTSLKQPARAKPGADGPINRTAPSEPPALPLPDLLALPLQVPDRETREAGVCRDRSPATHS